MSLLDMLFGRKPRIATVVRNRLQIIIVQERAQEGQAPDHLLTLRKELLGILSKYINVLSDDIHISREKQDGLDVPELDIALPE